MRVTRHNYERLRDAFVRVEEFAGMPSSAAADGGFDVPSSIGAKRLVEAEQALARLTPGGLAAVCGGAVAGGTPTRCAELSGLEALLKQFADGW